MKISVLVINILFILFSDLSQAQVTQASPLLGSGMSVDEIALRTKVRRKMYPGGIDEEPLKVQAQLPALKSKFVSEEDAPPPTDEVD